MPLWRERAWVLVKFWLGQGTNGIITVDLDARPLTFRERHIAPIRTERRWRTLTRRGLGAPTGTRENWDEQVCYACGSQLNP